MTLEEAIEHAEAQAIRNEKEAKRNHEHGGTYYDAEAQACSICAEQYKQLAEWLKELAERRKLPEIIHCGECVHSNKEYSGEMWCGICNGFGIDENSFCSFAEKRYVENG